MEGLFSPPNSVSCELAGHGDDQISNPESLGSVAMRTDWTDEKHSLYLKSMETLFVDQLYNSLDLHGSRSQKDCSDHKSSKQMHVSTRVPSGQFKILRDGCWAKINFRRGESALNNVDESRDLSVNPWIRHFRSGRSHQSVTNSSLQGKTAVAATNRFLVSQPQLCRYDSTDSNTEVTDQNFVNEDLEKEVASHTYNIKKMKTSAVVSSSNDQVVPYREFPMTEDVGKICSSPKE